MHSRVFPARPDQVREARRFMRHILAGRPVADDTVLCLSELASNSVLHSASQRPGGTFAVRAEVRDGEYVRIEVHDAGGPWEREARGDGRAHGLDIVRALAADAGFTGDAVTGRTAWARIDWPAEPMNRSPCRGGTSHD